MQYRREIDGLRAVAVLPVLLFHAGFDFFRGGFVGVDVFFVISGYLITSIILKEKEAGTFSLIAFYERRVRRILPALFVVMGVSAALAWFTLPPHDMKQFAHSLLAVSVFASNILFWRESGYFDTAAEMKPLLHTWSLAVEEQYYLLFPLFIMLAWRTGRRGIVALLAIAALGSLCLAQWAAYARPSAAFFLLPMRGWELGLGALVAFYLANNKTVMPPHAMRQILSVAGISLIAASIFLFDRHTPFPSLYALVPTIGTALIILCATPDTITGRLLGMRGLVGIGLISYAVYLWHQPLLAFLRHFYDGTPPDDFALWLALGLSFPLAYLTWRFVEKPFRDRARISRRTVFTLALVASLFFMGLGAAGSVTNGFMARFAPESRAFLQQVIDGPAYVTARFNNLVLKPFDAGSRRPKVLIIGDSYAQDIVNALAEGGLADRIQISAFYIPARCGNVYTTENLAPFIHKGDSELCARQGSGNYHTNQTLISRMKDADIIFLASSWKDWEAARIAQSMANIEQNSGTPVIVFGRKEFSEVHTHQWNGMTPGDRAALRHPLSESHRAINRRMKDEIDRARFVDISALVCGSDTHCPVFLDNRHLLSHDGDHLTAEGARILGSALGMHPALKKWLPQKN